MKLRPLLFVATALSLSACVDHDEPVTPPVTGALSFEAVAASEGTSSNSPATIKVSVSPTPTADLVLVVAAEPGSTAAQGADFILPSPSTLTIPAGSGSADFALTIVGDNVHEGTESLILSFTAATGEFGTAELTILDDEDPPVVSFASASRMASEATEAASATISLDTMSERDIRISLETGGSATVGTDVVLPDSGTSVTIPAGSRSVNYKIAIINDNVKEGGEVLTLTISNATNAEISENNSFDLILAGDYAINDTGVTTYTNGAQSDLVENPNPSRKQDADFGRDAASVADGFRLTKLDIDGNPMPPDTPIWFCVRDEVTGLIWEIKAPAKEPGMDNGYTFRSAAYRYTWYESDTTVSGSFAGAPNRDEALEDEADPHSGVCGYVPESPARSPASYCNTEDFVKESNRYAFCGRANWKLPTANQLQSLINYGEGRQALDPALFPTLSGNEGFFSSETAAGFPAAVLCLNTLTRRIEQCQKNVHHSVMLVSEIPQ